MPIRRPTIDTFVRYHNSASSLLTSCEKDFQARERDANIIYPLALKLAKTECNTHPHRPAPLRRSSVRSSYPVNETSDTEPDTDAEQEILVTPSSSCSSPTRKDEQFWLSQWSGRPTSPRELEFVLSCTTGPIGKYPIFLYSNLPDSDLSDDYVAPRIALLVSRLKSCLPAKRVFSVFGPVPLTRAFVNAWSQLTNSTPILDDPYYAAKHTVCTRQTLTHSPSPVPEDHDLRLADMSDLARAAELCYEFAAGSAPFILTREEATKEARTYIAARQLYVYNIPHPTSSAPQTASIVCVTRTSANVSAITKVFTNPEFRGRKCAEALVRHVCDELLFVQRKREVVLFVAHDNRAAEKVYDRVGFQGLCGSVRPEGVNDWLEIGFEESELGHW